MVSFFRFLFSGIGTVIISFLFLLIAFAPDWIGRLEGRIAPVVSGVEIVVEEDTEISAKITGDFHVERPACEFHHIEWRLITPHRRVLADVEFNDGTAARPGGHNIFGPWTVRLKKSELELRSVAEVFHDCPWRPWQTITHFYP